MHSYEYHHKSPEILQKAREKYSWLFDINYSDESIQVRYYLLEYLERKHGHNGIIKKDEYGKPIPINHEGTQLYWSISHSENYVAFIVSDNPTGIDIVEYRERDSSLLDIHRDTEYEILGEKSWINFSILWTAKESIIKLLGGQLDDIENIVCIDKRANNISIFAFQKETYKIQTFRQDSIIISYII